MTEYDNKLSGALFPNKYKTADKPKHPDLTGFYEDETGKRWRVAAWKRPYKGGTMLSFKVSEFEEQPETDDDF